jgi:drug/metabolite transporter (DMT)-like permease
MSEADAWQILVYRSLALTLFLAAVSFVQYRRSAFRATLNVGVPGILGAICLMVAYAFGILAMQMTTIADAVLLFATAPFFAAARKSVRARDL